MLSVWLICMLTSQIRNMDSGCQLKRERCLPIAAMKWYAVKWCDTVRQPRANTERQGKYHPIPQRQLGKKTQANLCYITTAVKADTQNGYMRQVLLKDFLILKTDGFANIKYVILMFSLLIGFQVLSVLSNWCSCSVYS